MPLALPVRVRLGERRKKRPLVEVAKGVCVSRLPAPQSPELGQRSLGAAPLPLPSASGSPECCTLLYEVRARHLPWASWVPGASQWPCKPEETLAPRQKKGLALTHSARKRLLPIPFSQKSGKGAEGRLASPGQWNSPSI